MKAYVAGAWVEQHERARPMIAKLRAAGIEITCDWTQAEGDVCACNHHRQRHAPYAADEISVLRALDRSDTCCADCACGAFNGIGSGGDSQLTVDSRIKLARADLEGVLSADVVWLLAANDKGACGSWVELGAALAASAIRTTLVTGLGIERVAPIIVVSGPKCRRTIFTEIADRLVEDDEEALRLVVEMHREMSGVRPALAP